MDPSVFLDSAGRAAYYASLRSSGKRIAGVCCTWVPEEILDAYSFVPVRLLADQAAPASFDALPASLCSFVRHLYQELRSASSESFDLLVIPTSCDSLVGLYSSLARPDPPPPQMHLLHAPASSGPAAIEAYTCELLRLEQYLRERTGHAVDLEQSVALFNETRSLLHAIRERTLQGAGRFIDLYRLALFASGVDRRDAIPVLRGHLGSLPPAPSPDLRPTVMLVAPVLTALELIEHIELCGARVGREWTTLIHRTIDVPEISLHGSIHDNIVARYVRRAASPTGPQDPDFHDRLASWAREVDGVIVLNQKGCEPFGFYRDFAVRLGIRSLYLEVETGQRSFDREQTALQTFVEVLTS